MPAVGFRFRAYAGQQTLGALKAQLRLACEVYNALRRADIDFHRRNGGPDPQGTERIGAGPEEAERVLPAAPLPGSAGDRRPVPRRQAEVPRGRATSADSWTAIWRRRSKTLSPGLRLEGRSRLQRAPQHS